MKGEIRVLIDRQAQTMVLAYSEEPLRVYDLPQRQVSGVLYDLMVLGFDIDIRSDTEAVLWRSVWKGGKDD